MHKIRIIVFAIGGSMAAIGGIMQASRLLAVNQGSGGSDLLLLAIAGPVIAGTSLFGGRGSVWSALLGALVIGSISNGMDLLALESSVKFMVTGGVLLAAVIVDAIARRQRQAAGRVRRSFLDQPVHKLDKKKRGDLRNSNIGFVFQSYHLLDDLTVFENLDIPLSYRNVKKPERQSIVCDTLDRFQIVGKKDLFPSQLSGGQQQLVAVARAVIAKPKLILADEPTGNLHSSQGEQIMELFKKLNEAGTTIIQVTHSEKNASFGHRIVKLADGWMES